MRDGDGRTIQKNHSRREFREARLMKYLLQKRTEDLRFKKPAFESGRDGGVPRLFFRFRDKSGKRTRDNIAIERGVCGKKYDRGFAIMRHERHCFFLRAFPVLGKSVHLALVGALYFLKNRIETQMKRAVLENGIPNPAHCRGCDKFVRGYELSESTQFPNLASD